MRILTSAQACGFGPASKLVAVSGLLRDSTIDFIGEGVALDFVRRHADRFAAVREGSTSDGAAIAGALAVADVVISVMDADLVYWAVRHRRPVLLFDSLLSFWDCGRSITDLARCAEVVRDGDELSARTAYDSLAPHEQVLLAHLLSTRSFVQNFPGVPERIKELAAAGAEHIELSGPILDIVAVRSALAAAPSLDEPQLLVNLGGFKNFYLDYDERNAYLTLIRRWVLELAAREPDLRSIMVCCGAFSTPEVLHVGGTRVEFTFLPHREFLRHLAHAPLYAVPPSLTSLHEAVIANRMPLLLPEQHYGHIANRRMLGDIAVGRHAAALESLGNRFTVAEDDFEGTRELDELVRGIMTDEQTYAEVRALLDARYDACRALSLDEREQAVGELAALLDGNPLDVLLADLDLTALQAIGAGR
ncbi:hypothetical protein [Actinoplanes sp. N902-109]|uniref:hypothetical protein n=1 Tax=Actinoplanes sp. (strain N902-109) TaxID=649831 RepID=UPI0003295A7A|nr:hypothetical protein [Actinoplanes sp. N902-109]AGL15001.1 hypothetical protein L083_1491 [Actinoplanes sp. N902-109]